MKSALHFSVILLIMMLSLGGCFPIKKVLVYPESSQYQIDNAALNQSMQGKKAIITLSNNTRTTGSKLSLQNDSLMWIESNTGIARQEHLESVKIITVQDRPNDVVFGVLFGAVLGGGLGSGLQGRVGDNWEGAALIGVGGGLMGSYGVVRLLSMSNNRIRYIIVIE